MGLSAARDASAVRGVLRKRDRSQSSSPGEGTAMPEAPRGKRRKTVAWRDGEELAHVVGCAESDVDRTPFDEPNRCGGCGLHCVGRMYACQLCAHDDFALCAVCFAAHVRITAALRAEAGRDAERRESTDADLAAAPDHAPTSPLTSSRPTAACPDLAVHPPANPVIRSDVDAILESAAATATAAADDEPQLYFLNNSIDYHPMDDDVEPEASAETTDDTRHSSDTRPTLDTEETHSSEGEEDLIELGDAGDGDGGLGTTFLGVHVHPPTAFLRRGCEDQEMLEEMLEEKRIRQAERESEAAAAAADVADEIGGTSEVTVTETGGAAPKEAEPAPAWDYRAEII